MKVLDRYLVRELIVPIVFASVSLIVLILIADVFDNLSEFIRFQTPAKVILNYYASLVPYAFVQTISWATWLGTLFLLVNFGFHNEMLAMKVAGLKFVSIIRPLVFVGFLIGIMTFLVSDRLLPWSYSAARELSEVYIEKKSLEHESEQLLNVTYHSADHHLYYFRTLSVIKQEAQDVIILWLDQTNEKTRQKITARKGSWIDGAWEFEQVTEHQVDARGKILGDPRAYPRKRYPDLKVAPKDLAHASQESIFLTYKEMKGVVKKLSETGVNVRSETVDLQYRLAAPWHSLVMMLLVFPLLGPTRTRRGIASWVLACVGIVFAFHVTSAISLALGKSGILPPFLSAWGGNIVFSVGALLTLDRANY